MMMMNSGNPDVFNAPCQDEPSGTAEDFSDKQEALRLIQAFRAIPDAVVRRTILELVEKVSRHMAALSRPVRPRADPSCSSDSRTDGDKRARSVSRDAFPPTSSTIPTQLVALMTTGDPSCRCSHPIRKA